MNQSQKLLFSLLRAALFEEKIDASKFVEADWKQIFNLSDIQTVSSLVLEGIGMLPHSVLQIPFDKKMMLFAKMQRMEQINTLHRCVIVKIDKALKAEGIQAVFMKGQTTAMRYPNPMHRTPGDIDFVVDQKDFKKTMEVLEKIGKVNHDLVHEHHGMVWHG